MSIPSLLDIYYDFARLKNFTPRKGIEEALNYLENGHNIIFKAPTGYGKTTMTEVLAKAIISNNTGINRVIHVLPYRAIIQDIYSKLKKDGFSERYIGAQDIDYHDSPFFIKKVNITTLDTFALNLFKLPTTEFQLAFKTGQSHFEFPRAMIYSSVILFDEFHLFGEGDMTNNDEEKEEDGKKKQKTLSVALATIKVLKEAGVPIVVMSATIDNGLEELLKKYLNDVKVVKPTDYNIRKNVTVDFLDNNEEIFGLIEKKLNEEITDEKTGERRRKKVLVVFNTRKEGFSFHRHL